jgi:hypothetical protein
METAATGTAAAMETAATTGTAAMETATTLEAPAACGACSPAPARGATRARVTHIAAPSKALERCGLSPSPGATKATALR